MSELRAAMERAHKALCQTCFPIGVMLAKKRASHEDLVWMHARLGEALANFGVVENDVREAYRLFTEMMDMRPKPAPKPEPVKPQGQFDFEAEMPKTVARQATRKKKS